MVKIMSTQTHLDLLIWSFSTFMFSALLLHLIYSQNCFKCLEDNITVHKATLLFDDIQINNTRRTTCDQHDFWMQYFQLWWFIYSSVRLNGSCWEWNWLYSRLEHRVDTMRGVKVICPKTTLHPSGMSIRLVSILSFLNTASSTSSFPTWKKEMIIIGQHLN